MSNHARTPKIPTTRRARKDDRAQIKRDHRGYWTSEGVKVTAKNNIRHYDHRHYSRLVNNDNSARAGKAVERNRYNYWKDEAKTDQRLANPKMTNSRKKVSKRKK